MKIRFGFVSNSSSSSFIIAFKSIPEIDQETKTKYPFVEKIFKKYEELLSRNGDIIHNATELDKFFIDRYGYKESTVQELLEQESPWYTEKYNDLLDKVNKGYTIIYTDIDYSDEATSELYYSLHDGVNFIVEGY